MFITQHNITALSPALVRAMRSILYTSSIKDRYASNVEADLRRMGEAKLADRLGREAAAYNRHGMRYDDGKKSSLADYGNLAADDVYDLSREYADALS